MTCTAEPKMSAQRLTSFVLVAFLSGSVGQTQRLTASAEPMGRRVFPATQPVATHRARDIGAQPLIFEPNRGQADAPAQFLARGTDSSWIFMPGGALAVRRSGSARGGFTLRLVGSNPMANAEALDQLPGVSNYFIGNRPELWRTAVPHYARLQYRQIYPGVDLIYHSSRRRLEYDFLVAAGADPKQIRLSWGGVNHISIDRNGDLALDSGGELVTQHKPLFYQDIGGSRRSVAGGYTLHPNGSVGFQIARYDATKPLVIDPVLGYSTYLGGSNDETPLNLAVDPAGNVYMTGETASSDFPITAGTQQTVHAGPAGSKDMFVTKVNPSGQIVYSTFIGGAGQEVGTGIAVDAGGNAYVTGSTTSTDFPTFLSAFQPASGGGQDAVVFKLNSAGQMVYSTYFGGSQNDSATGIAVDAAGNAYICGETGSATIANTAPVLPLAGATDAYMAKFNSTGTAVLAFTYLGGSSVDRAEAIALDPAGKVYLTGVTFSTNFPVRNASQAAFGGGSNDAFVTRLNPNATIDYSTYLGGSGNDTAYGIAVDPSGNAYVTGAVLSAGGGVPTFPVRNAIQATFGGGVRDGFATKLDAAGGVVFSTFLGGIGDDEARRVALDPAGDAYITGFTQSTNFPPNNRALYSTLNAGSKDAFVLKLTPDGSQFLFSSYLGGSSFELGIAIGVHAPTGSIWVAGQTTSSNFPTRNPVQATNRGALDVFLTKISEPVKIGVFRNGAWFQDNDGNVAYEGSDRQGSFGIAGDIPVAGDWTGDGTSKIGVFRGGMWFLDVDGNASWDGADQSGAFGISTDIPVVGDWDGTGKTKIGVFRDGAWYLNLDPANLNYNPARTKSGFFGTAGDIPVVGDWTGDGKTKVGVFRNGAWYLDMDGNLQWNPPVDVSGTFGLSTDIPIVGDWDGSGTTKIGAFRNGAWFLKRDAGQVQWNSGRDFVGQFGTAGDIPAVGDWDGAGKTKIGVFRNGVWYLDVDGNLQWDFGVDSFGGFGVPTDTAVVGRWLQ